MTHKNDMAVVSVLMPVRNGAAHIREAVESIVNQSLEAWECIVVNDHSTDETCAIVGAIADERIRLVPNEGRGLPAALNTGLSVSTGAFVARLDADDVSHPQRLAEQLDFLRQHPEVTLVGSQIRRVDQSGAPLSVSHLPTQHVDIIRHLMKGRHALAHSSVMFRNSGQRYESRPAEDWSFFLAASAKGSLANLDKVLIDYRFHSSSVNSTSLLSHRRDMYAVVDEYRHSQDRQPSGLTRHRRVLEFRARRDVYGLAAYRRSLVQGHSKVTRLVNLAIASALMPGAAVHRLTTSVRSQLRQLATRASSRR